MKAFRLRAAANSCSALRTATSRSGWTASPQAVTITGVDSEPSRLHPTA